MKLIDIIDQVNKLWPDGIESHTNISDTTVELQCTRKIVPQVCQWLANELGYHFVGLITEEYPSKWELRYVFVSDADKGYIHVKVHSPIEDKHFPSVSVLVHAADWHEREAEDLFGIIFDGHPRLGDFILHDDAWQEGVEPMRKDFDPNSALSNRQPRDNWTPRRIVDIPGAFIMPIGPIFSGDAESVHFQLETIGEEVIRTVPRLFFKYRGIEKLAENRSVDETLFLAERFSGTAAFSNALAFCLAVERISEVEIPIRAQMLRCFFAELERLRSHISTIEGICSSTGLVVAANQIGILEEKILRLTGYLTGHRYLFGLAIPGGLSKDCNNDLCKDAVAELKKIIKELNKLEKLLTNTSSFLDRIEEVGIVSKKEARNHGLVGPVARGAGYCNDLRKMQPYCLYDTLNFDVPVEYEGDGYARLRVLFSEARESLRIMEQITQKLQDGEIFKPYTINKGSALAGTETPRGATWHWINIDESGKIKRYKLLTPSFANWHGFHLAAENFAFQDFPIILATFGLSVAENDR